MNIWQAIVLGTVQGLTEFLPVSSSGHLVLLERLFGIDADCSMFLTVALHVGTLVPVFIVFAGEIAALFAKPWKNLGFLVVASLPAAIVGFLCGDVLDSVFFGGKYLVPCFIFTAIVLMGAEFAVKRRTKPLAEIGLKSAFAMGVAQAVAVIPGISRSGSTIAAGCFCGVERKKNADFAFLMSIPVILGSALLEGIGAVKAGEIGVGVMPLVFGVLAAAVSGYLAIKIMLKVIRKANYKWFALYLVILSAVLLIVDLV